MKRALARRLRRWAERLHPSLPSHADVNINNHVPHVPRLAISPDAVARMQANMANLRYTRRN